MLFSFGFSFFFFFNNIRRSCKVVYVLWTDIQQGGHLNMAVLFLYLVKRDLASLRYVTVVHWKSHFLQGIRTTRPCLSGRDVFRRLCLGRYGRTVKKRHTPLLQTLQGKGRETEGQSDRQIHMSAAKCFRVVIHQMKRC